MKSIFVAILCLVFFGYGITLAQEKQTTYKKMIKAPHFLRLAKANGNDIIKMECTGQAEFSVIDCKFTQIYIIRKTEAELTEEKQKRNLEYSKMTNIQFEETKKSFGLEKLTKERLALLDSLTPEKKKYTEKMFSLMRNVSASKNKTALINALNEWMELEDRCCTIRSNSWEDQFQRTSQFKWVSNPGPQGLCNVVRVSTLESNDDYYLLWKYTNVTVSVDFDKNRNDLFDRLCEGIEINKPVIYSWDIPSELALDCQCIKYDQ